MKHTCRNSRSKNNELYNANFIVLTHQNTSERIDILKKVSIFSDVSEKVLAKMLSVAHVVELNKNEIVFRKGALLNAMYIIIEGKVVVHDGQHVFAEFGRNDFFGEYSLIDSYERSATVTTTEKSILLRLDKKDFDFIMDENPKVARGILKALIHRLRKSNIQEEELIQNSSKIEKQKNILEQQRKELQELNETKDKFFSIIAHDLKNPFNTVIGLSDLMVQRFDSYSKEKLKEFSIQINRFSNDAYDLLENLLQWSRSQTNRINIVRDKINLYAFIEDIIGFCNYKSQCKNINLENKINKNIVVFTDKNLLSTILRNLINNAIKFTEKDGQIEIFSEKQNGFIKIHIKDDGIGMSEESLEKLFTQNSNISTEGTNSEKGTGLGLILVKEFVDKCGGELQVQSEINNGSDFSFTLPLK